MSSIKSTRVLSGWEGFRVGAVRRVEAADNGIPAQLWIELERRNPRRMRCSGCGRWVREIHDVTRRVVRDLPVLDAETRLIVPRVRVACPRCGPKLESLRWLAPYSRVTARLADSVARLCSVLPIKHVAEFYGLGWDQVKAIDKAYLRTTLGPVDLRGVEVIALDDFAIRRGYQYATVVLDPERKRVLWVGRGRGRTDIRPFFRLLGKRGRRRLKAAVMDMWKPYEAEVRFQCSNVEIVYDPFHILSKYGQDVIDRVRIDQANALRRYPAARKVVKAARWLLLKNAQKLKGDEERIRLEELLRANEPLMTVYVLKEDLRRLWQFRSKPQALRFFWEWYQRAMDSGIRALRTFAEKLLGFLPGILAHCRWPLHTHVLEGINNKIKVMKRMAYGFRDDDYFFLKIHAAFPGIPG